MYVAVPIPPLRLFRLGGESRYDALGLFLHLLLHFGLSRKAFLSETLAGKAVMARTLPLRIVHATDNKRPPFVRPTERYRSSLSIGSKFRSTGSLFSNCSNSAGDTLWASRCFLFSSSQSNSIVLATALYCIATYIRSGFAPTRFTVRRCARPNTSLHPAGLVAIMPSGEPEEPGSIPPDAVVAAWLPGSEGQGGADVVFREPHAPRPLAAP